MWNEVLENLVVVKRSGQRVEFNASKIAIAIKKAFDAVYQEPDEKQIYKVFENVLKYINNNYGDRKTINVEDIQDTIESQLNNLGFKEVYEAFSDYRQRRAASRKVFNEKQQHKFTKVTEAIENIDASLTPQQMLYKFGKIISSEYAKSYILDSKYVRAYEEGNMYIHNLESFPLGYISYLNLKLGIKNDDLDEFINGMVNAQNEVGSEIGINNLDILLEKYSLNNFKKILKKKIKYYF
jgi:ribonucleoside-triphosphate reductase